MLKYMKSLTAPARLNQALRIIAVDRRAFLTGSTAAAGLTLAGVLSPAGAFEPYDTGGLTKANGLVTDPLVFVAIDPDGTVTITAHRSEMGQGSRTSLPMVLADEMGADWDRVRIVQAPGDQPLYGNQDTDGSRSMRHHIQSMRQMGAAARTMLARAAAAHWGVAEDDVTAGVHEVASASGDSLGFGELAEAAMALPVPELDELAFKDEADFRYMGKGNVAIYDLRDITMGTAVYGADVSLPGMKYSVIARPPVVGGTVASYDASAALEVAGVESVVEMPAIGSPVGFAPLGGIAVVASNTWAAIEGRSKLEIQWDNGANASYDSTAYQASSEAAAEAPGLTIRDQGDWDAAKDAATRTFSAIYRHEHVAHAPMEPPVALANATPDSAEIWAPVQSPYTVRQDIAKALEIDESAVTVHPTLLGGGFGRKSKGDFAMEAALISSRTGAPVRVQWTREDDIRHGFYAAASVDRLEASIDANGKVTGLLHRVVAPTIISTFAPDPGYLAPFEKGMGHVDNPFDIGSIRCEIGQAMAHTRIGWFRSVNNEPRAFAIQSFVAELAHELGRDHRELLLELIGPAREIDIYAMGLPEPSEPEVKFFGMTTPLWNYGEPQENYPIDTGRLANVLNVAADAAGWGQDVPDGEGIGLAVHRSFVSYVATAARVRVSDGQIRVPEMHMAVDCGYAANPERIRSQMEGSAVMGMTLALHSGITFEHGAVQQSNFNDYGMVRSDNFPQNVTTHIIKHPFSVHASGVGEPGLPPVAPAIANGIFQATGKRLRDMPIGETA